MSHNHSILHIASMLLEKKESIAVAESVTSGFLQAAVSSADNAINFFQGGITAYNLGQKSRHLNIDPIHAIECNCVSQKIPVDMALNVSRIFSSHWGIGITGYATAVPELANKIFAYYAITHNHQVLEAARINCEKKEPTKVQLYYTNFIIDQLKQIIV